MKILLALILFPVVMFSQSTTYSNEEEKMLQYVNNQYAYAMKYDSLEMISSAIDSCWQFLHKYPKSFAKPGVFEYMVKMTIFNHSTSETISALIDSSLFYDSSSVNEYSIANDLIESNILIGKGYLLLTKAFPKLSASYHIYKANILFARKAIKEGRSGIARMYFERALSADSTRAEGWYEYAAYLKFSEQPGELLKVKREIQSLDKAGRLKYEDYSKNSQNIGKDFLDFKLPDLNGNIINLTKYKDKPLIAQYFSNWCPQPQKYPVLEEMSKEFPEAKIILINVGESPEELKSEYLNKPNYKYLDKYKIVFEDSSLSNSFTNITMGTLFLIDKSGKIVLELKGYSKDYGKLLQEAIKKLFSK